MVRAANPDVLGVATLVFDDGVAIPRQMKALNVNPRMVGFPPAMSRPRFYEVLGRDGEFVYVAAVWLPELVEVWAGGLIPIARQYPGRGSSSSPPGRSSPAPLRLFGVRRLSGSSTSYGKRAIVWPEELAPDKARFPTPPWSQRP